MGDDHFGHRDFITGDPIRDKDEYSDWDHALIVVLQILEDNTNQHGLLRWVAESDRVEISADRKTDKFQASVDQKTKGTKKKPYQPRPGEYFVPGVDVLRGEMPTFREYQEELREKMSKEAEKNSDGTID